MRQRTLVYSLNQPTEQQFHGFFVVFRQVDDVFDAFFEARAERFFEEGDLDEIGAGHVEGGFVGVHVLGDSYLGRLRCGVRHDFLGGEERLAVAAEAAGTGVGAG